MLKQKTEEKVGGWLRLLHRYGWMALFMSVCLCVYFQAINKKSALCQDLKRTIETLEEQKALAILEGQELTLQIQSQGDPDWIEMVLKKSLGLVPESQQKVYFQTEE